MPRRRRGGRRGSLRSRSRCSRSPRAAHPRRRPRAAAPSIPTPLATSVQTSSRDLGDGRDGPSPTAAQHVLAAPVPAGGQRGMVEPRAGDRRRYERRARARLRRQRPSRGVRPTNLLTFSPLIFTSDAGRSWSTGLLSQGLAASPDALAADRPRTCSRSPAPAGSNRCCRAPPASRFAHVDERGCAWRNGAGPGLRLATHRRRVCRRHPACRRRLQPARRDRRVRRSRRRLEPARRGRAQRARGRAHRGLLTLPQAPLPGRSTLQDIQTGGRRASCRHGSGPEHSRRLARRRSPSDGSRAPVLARRGLGRRLLHAARRLLGTRTSTSAGAPLARAASLAGRWHRGPSHFSRIDVEALHPSRSCLAAGGFGASARVGPPPDDAVRWVRLLGMTRAGSACARPRLRSSAGRERSSTRDVVVNQVPRPRWIRWSRGGGLGAA